MRNNRIRLTESQLHNVIKESVKKAMIYYREFTGTNCISLPMTMFVL